MQWLNNMVCVHLFCNARTRYASSLVSMEYLHKLLSITVPLPVLFSGQTCRDPGSSPQGVGPTLLPVVPVEGCPLGLQRPHLQPHTSLPPHQPVLTQQSQTGRGWTQKKCYRAQLFEVIITDACAFSSRVLFTCLGVHCCRASFPFIAEWHCPRYRGQLWAISW